MAGYIRECFRIAGYFEGIACYSENQEEETRRNRIAHIYREIGHHAQKFAK
jgi:hypothetical protein